MAWYQRNKLDDISTKIGDSTKQLEVYLSERHLINPEYIQFLSNQIKYVSIKENLSALEHTGNIIEELKNLLKLEEKRRNAEAQLNEIEKKGVVKKARADARKKKMDRRSDPYVKMRQRQPSGYSLRSTDDSSDEAPTAVSSRQ